MRSRIAVNSSAGRDREHHAARAAATATNIATIDTTNIKTLRDADRQELQEALDQRDVGRRAADELAGLQLVVAREVERLQLTEHRGAQVVLHVERDATTAVAADVREDEHARRRARRAARATAQSGRSCVGDDVVDDDLLHERQERLRCSCPPIATPNAMYACFLCGAM